MKNIFIVGKNSQDLVSLVTKLGFSLTDKDPQVVISYGGDGTLLSAERKYPGIPKLPIRENSICVKCQEHEEKEVLDRLKDNKLKYAEISKLEAKFLNHHLTALNDLVIRNSLQMHAIRFKVFKNQKPIGPDLVIGDGIVVSTPFGSTGYFKSITKKDFTKGFGLAFNNATQNLKPIFFSQEDKLQFLLTRGPANLSYDNFPQTYPLAAGDKVEIKPSSQKARIYLPQTLKCPNCQLQRNSSPNT